MLEDDDQDQLQQQQGQGAVPVLEENPTPADYNQAMNISRKMYLGGFAFLPWLWLINFIGFRNVLKDQNAPEEFKLCKILNLLFGFFECLFCEQM
jgi:hypothetical protein